MHEIEVRSNRREEVIDITALVRGVVKRSGVTEGIVWAFCPHTTAGLTVQENADPDVKSDMLLQLGRLVPQEAGFAHAEGNADAHIKASLLGTSCALPVTDGDLLLGTWQAIWFCEFDGPRSRRVRVKVVEG